LGTRGFFIILGRRRKEGFWNWTPGFQDFGKEGGWWIFRVWAFGRKGGIRTGIGPPLVLGPFGWFNRLLASRYLA